MRENERNEASRTIFPKTLFLGNELNNEYKVFFGVFHITKPNTIYQKIQNKTLLHREEVGKTQKSSKSQMWQTFL